MKKIKLIFIVFILVLSVKTFSQKYNFTVGSSSILFNRFYNHKVVFNGLSFNYSSYFKRIGVSADLSLYFPSSYYGSINRYSFDYLTSNYNNNYIPVYMKGKGYSLGLGSSYKLFVSKSQKTILQTEVNFTILFITETFNTEPFVRIYGGTDNYGIGAGSFSFGLKITKKAGAIPLTLSLKRHLNIQSKENYALFSGYTELKFGITFPIIFGPAPNTIKKIKY